MENNLIDEVICRTCLSIMNKNETISIYSVSEILMLCSSIQILESDGLPPSICSSCHNIAQTAYDFRFMCEKSDKKLRERLLDSIKSVEVTLKKEVVDLSAPVVINVTSNDNEKKRKIQKKPEIIDITESKSLCVTYDFKYRKTRKCHESGKVYRSALHLSQHMNSHKPKYTHPCNTCGKQFTCRSNLLRHHKIHTGEKPHICVTCNKKFTYFGDLKTHMVTHSLEKSYLCSFCGNKFARKNTLQTHITRKHSDSNPSFVTCEVCGKSFKDKVTLTRHKYIHTGEKNYKCKVCDKSFNRRNNLSVHERTHKNDRPFTCTICQRGFNQKHVLNTHMEKTHFVQEYTCPSF